MFKRTISAALIFGAAALAPPVLTPAHAQTTPACFERTTLVETLTTRFSESLTGGGLQTAGQLLEIWSSDKTGSFTVFITHANGTSCVVASGNNWHSTPIAVLGTAS